MGPDTTFYYNNIHLLAWILNYTPYTHITHLYLIALAVLLALVLLLVIFLVLVLVLDLVHFLALVPDLMIAVDAVVLFLMHGLDLFCFLYFSMGRGT